MWVSPSPIAGIHTNLDLWFRRFETYGRKQLSRPRSHHGLDCLWHMARRQSGYQIAPPISYHERAESGWQYNVRCWDWHRPAGRSGLVSLGYRPTRRLAQCRGQGHVARTGPSDDPRDDAQAHMTGPQRMSRPGFEKRKAALLLLHSLNQRDEILDGRVGHDRVRRTQDVAATSAEIIDQAAYLGPHLLRRPVGQQVLDADPAMKR